MVFDESVDVADVLARLAVVREGVGTGRVFTQRLLRDQLLDVDLPKACDELCRARQRVELLGRAGQAVLRASSTLDLMAARGVLRDALEHGGFGGAA